MKKNARKGVFLMQIFFVATETHLEFIFIDSAFPDAYTLRMTTPRTFAILIAILFVLAPFSASAASVYAPATVQTATREQIQAQIQTLLAQIHVLQALIAESQAATSSPSAATAMSGGTTVSASSSASTLVVSLVPLLSGGVVHAGTSVPVSYLQVTNTGKSSVTLTGFRVAENGSAPVQSIIGFTAVDDKATLRTSVGGVEGATPFVNGTALVPMNMVFAPGQMRLFTIKAVLTMNVASYLGKQLVIDVTGLETDAGVKGSFPIHGTTWTIAY